ncbi:PAS domain S-box protein [Trichocoleus sp. FACHB-69]|nr:PAS domain S-box protein [Trichocoleus sp. FACHB-69]
MKEISKGGTMNQRTIGSGSRLGASHELPLRMDRGSPRSGVFSIANQLRYGLVLLVVLALLITSGMLISLSFQAQIEQVEVAQQERSLVAAGEINAYLDDLQRKLSYLARVQGLTDFSPEIQQTLLEALTRHNSAYEKVAIFNKNGEVVSEYSPYDDSKFSHPDDYRSFGRAFKQKEDIVSPVRMDAATKLPVVTLALPIRNQQDLVDGVLMARINLNFLWFIVSQIDVGKTGYTYVIDNRKYLIAEKGIAPNNYKLHDISNYTFIKKLTKLKGAKTLKNYQGLKGVEVVGAIAPIRSVRWKVVVELPTAEAYAPVQRMLFVMGIALSVAMLLAAELGWFFSRQIVSPLQRLTQAAAKISAGNLDTQVTVNRHNEMGVLATTFNEMTAQLRGLIKELRKERNFVSAILDTAGALMIVVDRQGRIIRFNTACEEITNYSFAEVKDQPFWDIFLIPEEAKSIKDIFDQLHTGKFPKTYDNYWTTRDGTRRLISWSTTVLLDADSSIKYMIGTGIDITERKRAEEALLLSEEKFSKAFLSSPDSIAISTIKDGRYVEINESLLRTTGYTREELIGHTAIELNIWNNPEDRLKMIDMLQEAGNIRNLECEFRKKSGEVAIGLLSAEIINFGDELCVLAVVNDITERKAADAQLRDALERDRLLGVIALRIRQSLDLQQILDTTVSEVRNFLSADRVFISRIYDDFQVVAESVIPPWRPIQEWTPKNEEHYQAIRKVFENKSVHVVKDTSQIEISSVVAEDFNNYQIRAFLAVPIILDEEPWGLLIVDQCTSPRDWQQSEIDLLSSLGTQVTIAIKQAKLYQEVQDLNARLERKVEERTAQLSQKMQELKELNELKDEFLHAVSHDLRTPIMGMSLVVNNLLNKSGETIPISRSILERMIQSSDRQLSLINSLLETHSSEVRGVILNYQLVQLGQLTSAIAQDMEPLLLKNQATLNNLVPASLPGVTADPLQLRRVFENLLTNALNHNPPGLILTLQATVEEEMVHCTVADNGVGMNPEACDHLFERYVRGSRARSTGIGLGLYLCRQIITAHGGQIGAISAPGAGATFWFTLPLFASPTEEVGN